MDVFDDLKISFTCRSLITKFQHFHNCYMYWNIASWNSAITCHLKQCPDCPGLELTSVHTGYRVTTAYQYISVLLA